MDSRANANAPNDATFEDRRIGPFAMETAIFGFFLLASFLELLAQFGRRVQWISDTQRQVMHVCVYCAIALSAVAVIRRLNNLPRVRIVLEIALTMLVVSEVLDLIRSIPRFQGIPFVSDTQSHFGDLLNRSLHTVGLSIYMASFYICLLELNGVEARLRFALQNMPVMLDAVDANGVFLEWNRECERVTGYAKGEIIGNPDAMRMLYPDEQSPGRFPGGELGAEDYRDWETVIACKDGSRKTISWSSQSNAFSIAGWAAWGVGVDLTLSRSLERELMRIERADAVGKLVGGIASKQELFLDPVRAQLMKLRQENSLTPVQRSLIDESLRNLDKMNDIVRRLTVLGRKTRTLPGNTDLAVIVDHVVEETKQHPLASKATIRVLRDSEPMKGAIAAEDFDRALSAVLANAIEAIAAPGAQSNLIEISHRRVVETGRPPDRILKTGLTGTPRSLEVITVRDRGAGFANEILERATEPFVSSKLPQEHAGLGLTLAQSLLRKARGRLEIENNPEGGGAAVHLCIPINSPNNLSMV